MPIVEVVKARNSDDWITIKKNEFFSLQKNRFSFEKRRVALFNTLGILQGVPLNAFYLLAVGNKTTELAKDFTLFVERLYPIFKSFQEGKMQMEMHQLKAIVVGLKIRRSVGLENFKKDYYDDYDAEEEIKFPDEEEEAEPIVQEVYEFGKALDEKLEEINIQIGRYYNNVSEVDKIKQRYTMNSSRVAKTHLYAVKETMGEIVTQGRILDDVLSKIKKKKFKMNEGQNVKFKRMFQNFKTIRKRANELAVSGEVEQILNDVKVLNAEENSRIKKRIEKCEQQRNEVEMEVPSIEDSLTQVQAVEKRFVLKDTDRATMDFHLQEQEETRKELLETHGDMNELMDIMKDMKILVDTQTDVIQTIEDRVDRSVHHVQKGRKAVRTARKHQKGGLFWRFFGK